MTTDAPYGKLEQLEPGIARLLAPNPSAFTFTGTQSYVVGEGAVAVIDPGPDLPSHVDALLAAVGGRHVTAIVCTHSHRDHSPAARPLAQATGAPLIGCAPLQLDGSGLEAGFDPDYAPDQVLADGETVVVDGRPLQAVATPGHTSNHLCFAYRDVLFSGDHVMGWSTSVVIPPDGSMGDYMRSLHKLRHRSDRIYLPGHGDPVTNPQQYVRHLLGHRMQREKQILKLVEEGARAIPQIVASAYPGLDPRLVGAAGMSVLAHLLDLHARGLVEEREEQWAPRT